MKLKLVVSRLSPLLVVLTGTRNAVAQSVIRSLAGAASDKLGSAIADAGDTNGDNWRDYLVGMPSANGGRGAVTCVSGRWLATGIAPARLYTYAPPFGAANTANFGKTLAALGDVDGDGSIDFAVGAPNFDSTTPTNLDDCGAVLLFNGSTHALSGSFAIGSTGDAHLGSSLSSAGDMNGDGVGDVIAGSPGVAGEAKLISGAHLAANFPSPVIKTFYAPQPLKQWGEAVLGGIDFDGDGLEDLAIAAPHSAQVGHTDQGLVRIHSGAFGNPVLADYWGADGSATGRALAGGADLDGDGRPDLVAGAYFGDGGSAVGKVVVLSGGRLIQHVQPYELFAWLGPSQLGTSTAFGAALAFAPDLNGDGVDDVLVGMPSYNPTLTAVLGAVRIYSGKTGGKIGALSGVSGERLGSAVLGSSADFDNDGYLDFLVGGTESDTPSNDCGVLKALRLFPAAPSKYCVGKLNSQGCTPSMSWSGIASVSGPAFLVRAINVLNQKNGLLFYGSKPVAVPFQGGVKCVKSPTIRTAVQSSGGSASGNDCSGTLAVDFNAWIQSGVDPQLVVGEEVFCQYWSRDPASASTTSLSDALVFLVNP